jgi:hypothetical protein
LPKHKQHKPAPKKMTVSLRAAVLSYNLVLLLLLLLLLEFSSSNSSSSASSSARDSDYPSPASLSPDRIAILQFDSRPLRNYWQTAATWNARYCAAHGHRFLYYTLPPDDRCHHDQEPLASAWCKVRAMLNAYQDHPEVSFFIYLDSDAVVDQRFAHQPLNRLLETMQSRLAWDFLAKPVVFNQDGACWWCSLVVRVGYTVCLNAGTVAFYRHPTSWQVLSDWWDASMDDYESNPIKRCAFVSRYCFCVVVVLVVRVDKTIFAGYFCSVLMLLFRWWW